MKREREDGSPETAEQIGKELLKFVGSTEFGTPPYQAASDYLNLQELYQHLRLEKNNERGSKKNTSENWYASSKKRITELKIALLEHQISQNQSRLRGYAYTYFHMESEFDGLGMLVADEAHTKFPSDELTRQVHFDDIYGGFFEKAQDIVFSQREQFDLTG